MSNQTLSGQLLAFSTLGLKVSLSAWPTVIVGMTTTGTFAPFLVGADGSIITTASGQFAIPAFDTQAFSYFGSTNNVQTILYKKAGTTVATLTFTYVGGGSANDDNVASIVQS